MAPDNRPLLNQRYRLDRLIARGGFGAVYQAYDTVLRRVCAVKENLAQHPAASAQFEQEALILASLRHPNLPRVFDHFVQADGRQYLVMEFVEGENLDALLRRRGRPLGEAEALAILQPIGNALAYLHSQVPPVVHRDVKPQNIIVTPERQVLLVDFGLSKRMESDLATVPGARGITPGYAAPEQYGLGPTDPRSDVYSLGATLYTLLTAQRPPDALQRLAGDAVLTPIVHFNPGVSTAVQSAVEAALALPATQRLPSVVALQHRLAGTPGTPPRPRTALSLAIAAGLIGAALLLTLALGTRHLWRPELIAGTNASPVATLAASTPRATPPQLPAAIPTLVPTATSTSSPTPTPMGGGGRITFVSDRSGNRDIYVMAPDGTGLVNLTSHPADDWVAAWSPNGQQLAFDSDRSGNWDIYLLDTDTGEVTQVTADLADDHDPDWSPDGQQLVFHSNRSGYWRLHTMAVDGSDVRPLTDDPAGDWAGSWSPDGAHILYAHNFAQPGEVFIMDADGSRQTNLTNSAEHESAARWSADGNWIVFYSDRDGNRELYSMQPDGSGQTRLTSHPATDTHGAWSPDGQRLVFASDRDGDNDLYILELATGTVARLAASPGDDSNPLWTAR